MSEEIGFLGEGKRLGEPRSVSLAGAAFARELETASYMWSELNLADIAHVRELVEAQVIGRDDGRALITWLLDFQDKPLSDVELDPMVGDVYNNRDALLEARYGPLVGKIHTGRARREATTLAWQLRLRYELTEAVVSTAELGRAIIAVANPHRSSVMPDYTYLQHAQPTSFGHYLAGFGYAVARCGERLVRSLESVNRSPAGSGSTNGTRFPLDRERLARSLEFDGVITHTRDAMWSPDVAIEVAAAAVAGFTTLDRLVEDLQVFASSEFAFIEFADRHCRTSVIMPQKKNPYGLAMIRGHARQAVGDLTAIVASNLTVTGQPDNRTPAYDRLIQMLLWFSKSSILLAEMLSAMRVDVTAMRRQASVGFPYATDLCDWLVEAEGVNNRTAHDIVGLAVRWATERGHGDVELSDLLQAASVQGVSLDNSSREEYEAILDPDHLLSVRVGIGGAAQIEPMLQELSESVDELREFNDHPIRDFEQRFLAEVASYKEQL